MNQLIDAAVMCLHQCMASMNLKNTYFPIGLVVVRHKFLRFHLLDKYYQFRSLPFGLSSALQVLTKTLPPLILWFRLMGVQLYPYLDDLILGDSPTEVSHSVWEEWSPRLSTMRLAFCLHFVAVGNPEIAWAQGYSPTRCQ